jgi:iron complex outermembrane receptor protein
VIDKEDFSWDVSGNASFLSNKITNFAGFLTGGINGQYHLQVLMTNQFTLTICMSERI